MGRWLTGSADGAGRDPRRVSATLAVFVAGLEEHVRSGVPRIGYSRQPVWTEQWQGYPAASWLGCGRPGIGVRGDFDLHGRWSRCSSPSADDWLLHDTARVGKKPPFVAEPGHAGTRFVPGLSYGKNVERGDPNALQAEIVRTEAGRGGHSGHRLLAKDNSELRLARSTRSTSPSQSPQRDWRGCRRRDRHDEGAAEVPGQLGSPPIVSHVGGNRISLDHGSSVGVAPVRAVGLRPWRVLRVLHVRQ